MYYKKRLIDVRTRKELKQKDLSSMLGLKSDVYGHYEREETLIPMKHLNSISNYLNVSIDFLFNFTNKEKYLNSKENINKGLFRERIRELRKEYGITQANLANSINVASSTISDYERKAKIIATPFLYDICKKYGISADYLLGKTDMPKYYDGK